MQGEEGGGNKEGGGGTMRLEREQGQTFTALLFLVRILDLPLGALGSRGRILSRRVER